MREGMLTGIIEADDFSEENVMKACRRSCPDCPRTRQLKEIFELRPSKEIGMVAIFLGLFFGYALLELIQRGPADTFANPVFLGQANLLNLTRSIGLFGIFSVAMGVVIITGGIDLSIGSQFALLGSSWLICWLTLAGHGRLQC